MRYLVDILHPAHVHVLRNAMSLLEASGHEIVITARKKDVATELLKAFGIEHTVISEQRPGTVNLAKELALRTYRLARIARDRRVDALVGVMGPSIAPVGKLLGIPSFVLYDTEIATRTNRWVYPLATQVITPECYSARVRGTHVTYRGYHELAYLHPNRFTPRNEALTGFGIDGSTGYVVVRFPEFVSSHDGNEIDTDREAWTAWLEELAANHAVYVSAEGDLPAGLERFRMQGPVADIHHVLAYADLVIGESATMASEAAVLGTPAVFIGATSRGYVDDIEKRYGLIKRSTPDQFDEARAAAAEFLEIGKLEEVAAAHKDLISDHIDVSEWLAGHLEASLDTGALS